MWRIPFAIPDIDEAEITAVSDALRSGWISTGPRTKEFEKRFAEFVGAPQAVAVNSGTSGLHLALLAAGVGPGDEVIVPSYTFTASAATVIHCGAVPRLVDVEPSHLTIDPSQVEAAINERTKAIMPVHYGGRCCDMAALQSICDLHGVRIVEDAAHALPTRSPWGLVGAGPNITVFSFYATKTLTTGEGGMVTASQPEVIDQLRLMSLHGMSRDAWKRYLGTGSWFYEVTSAGFKYNMGDIQGALGLAQLDRLVARTARRRDIAEAYSARLGQLESVEIPCMDDPEGESWHLYPLRLNLSGLRISRDNFIDRLAELGVGCSVHFIPLHLHPYYRSTLDVTPEMFPVSQHEFEREISLPIYPSMTDDDVDYVIRSITDLCEEYAR